MRKSGKWMVLLDERILELFDDSEEEFMSPADIGEHKGIPYSKTYIAKRCRKLAEHGLLNSIGRGVYTITDEGRAYLREEYNAAESGNANAGISNNNGAGESADEA